MLTAVLLCLRWLFEGLGREKAEELLQLPDTKVGSFMIRESETKKGESPVPPCPAQTGSLTPGCPSCLCVHMGAGG